MSEKTYPIGTEYLSHGKCPRLCRVVDIWRTYNEAGDLVRVRYVTDHEFCGQRVVERDVVAVTVARGIWRLQAKEA